MNEENNLKISNVNNENQNLRNEISKHQDALRYMKEENNVTISSMKNENQNLRDEILKNQDALRNISIILYNSSARIISLEAGIQHVSMDLTQYKPKTEEMRAALTNQIYWLNNTFKSLEAVIQNVATDLAQYEPKIEEVRTSLTDQITSLSNAAKSLEAGIMNVAADLAQYKPQTEQMRISLTSQITLLNNSAKSLETGIQSVATDLAQYKPKTEEMRISLTNQITSLSNTAQSLDASKVPVGSIHWFPSVNCPSNFLKLNGALVSRVTFAALWNFAQSSGNLRNEGRDGNGQFGIGDGSTTFSLPDFRGLTPRSWDDGRGLDSGRALGTYQASQNLLHSHGVSDPGHNHYVNDPGHQHTYGKPNVPDGQVQGGKTPGTNQVYYDSSAVTKYATTRIYLSASSSNIGIHGDGGAETRVQNVAMLACIKH